MMWERWERSGLGCLKSRQCYQQQTHTQLQSLPSALHWHWAHISVQPSGGIGLIGLMPQVPGKALAGSGAAEVSKAAPAPTKNHEPQHACNHQAKRRRKVHYPE